MINLHRYPVLLHNKVYFPFSSLFDFYTCYIFFKPKTGSMGVAQGPSKEKVAVLAVDDCDISVALKFSSEIANYTCAAEGIQSSSKK